MSLSRSVAFALYCVVCFVTWHITTGLQGDDKSKKKVMKASEKFRFNFDWDGKEDTSKDLNPLYNNLHRESCSIPDLIC
jgi:hypothetical protein